jgi:hypothetical protein
MQLQQQQLQPASEKPPVLALRCCCQRGVQQLLLPLLHLLLLLFALVPALWPAVAAAVFAALHVAAGQCRLRSVPPWAAAAQLTAQQASS